MMPEAPLRGDCDRCAALCCVAHAFDRSPAFAFDKPAGVPCRNLTAELRCTVHDRLREEGFAGCVAYDCYGAGQAVTQEMFGGRSWRDDPALLAPMMDAFLVLRRVHELRALLVALGSFDLSDAERRKAERFGRDLADASSTREALARFDRTGLAAEIRAFLGTVRLTATAAGG